MRSFTKIESYRKTRPSAGTVRDRILQFIQQSHVPVSRSRISETLNIRLSCVTGRVNELLGLGLIEVAGIGFDPKSNRRVEILSSKRPDEAA